MKNLKDSVFIIALVVTIISYKYTGNFDDALACGGLTIVVLYVLVFISAFGGGDKH